MNGGKVTTSKQSCVVNNVNQPVWFYDSFITNVLSLALLSKKYRITYDSGVDGAFIVHRENKP